MKCAVAHHRLRLAERLHGMYRLLQRPGGNMWIDARQRCQQAIVQDDLPVIGPFRVRPVRRHVRPMHKLPAGFPEPDYAQVFELLFIQHAAPSWLPGNPSGL